MSSELLLKRGEVLLGILHPVEQGRLWTTCTFEPTPSFAAVQPLFAATLALWESEDMDAWEAGYVEIEALHLSLTDAATGRDLGDFALNIDQHDAWLLCEHIRLAK